MATGRCDVRGSGDHVLLHTSGGTEDDWRLWLTAAGMPTQLSKQPDTFDLTS